MTLLDECIVFAVRKHSGQLDKVGLPYIYHPLRVMMDPTICTDERKCVAILHDVLEDTDTTKEEILELTQSVPITHAVVLLTHPLNEPNITYWQRIRTDSVALAVKIADIKDNMSPARMSCLPIKDQERLRKKYTKALEILETNMA